MKTKTPDFHAQFTRLGYVEKAVGDFSMERDNLAKSLDSSKDEIHEVIGKAGDFSGDLRNLDTMYSEGSRVRRHNLERVWGRGKLGDFGNTLNSLGIKKDHRFDSDIGLNAVKRGVIVRPWKDPYLINLHGIVGGAVFLSAGAATLGFMNYIVGEDGLSGTEISVGAFTAVAVPSLAYMAFRRFSSKNPFSRVADEIDERTKYLEGKVGGD